MGTSQPQLPRRREGLSSSKKGSSGHLPVPFPQFLPRASPPLTQRSLWQQQAETRRCLKTHGTCEKRGKGKRDKKGVRIEVEGRPWENGMDRAGLAWQWDYLTLRELG